MVQATLSTTDEGRHRDENEEITKWRIRRTSPVHQLHQDNNLRLSRRWDPNSLKSADIHRIGHRHCNFVQCPWLHLQHSHSWSEENNKEREKVRR